MPATPRDPPSSVPDHRAAISPEFARQDFPDSLDHVAPAASYDILPMVGLGGSAGSLSAMQQFFKAAPEKTGFAFVVVVHLSPEHASLLPELLARTTKMPVRQAEDGQRVAVDHVYVIPPGKLLTAVDGHLRLTDLDHERGTRVAVDLFFRSLAETHGPQATAIVLSGADGDGAIGIKRIKECGGLTIAQDPEESEHHGMPQSAIATGMVDWVLPVGEMPQRLVEYRASEQRLRMPPEEGAQPAQPPPTTSDEDETALREVLTFLRSRTSRDFACYKRATIVRRVTRRMQINSTETLPAYLSFLRTHPGEAGALLQDLLISVTNFFRDRDAFAALELMIPELFRGKGAGDTVRVWTPACATGEEAYSIAILVLEYARTLDVSPAVQIFACDLDESAVQLARAGAYPETIIADVSEERLRRFFLKEARGWRIRREVREVVLFAAHDLLKDAPFSRMDLISCRNLFIYLNRDAQKRALSIFHFALKPQALLFLGSSESVEEESALFEVTDKKHRIYRHRPAPRIGLPVPIGPGTLLRALEAQDRAKSGPVLPGPSFEKGERHTPGAEWTQGADHVSLGELHFRLVEKLAAPSVIVNPEHEIVHLSEHAGRFFTLAGGETSTNLLRIVHPMLRLELRGALFQAEESGAVIEVPNLPLELEGRRRAVTLRVLPARELAPGFLLVVFEMSDAPPDGAAAPAGEKSAAEAEPIVRQLEREVEATKSRLRDTVEQYEASAEELKASNEELQAMNEELRSASEELETSREELQSINEELSTVNAEFKSKLEEVGRTNSDLHNFISATAIATIFLDRDLRIMRYTPSAAAIFRFIPSDIGRLLTDLRPQLDYAELNADAERVLTHLSAIEREVRDANGRHFLAKLLPYRTIEDHIGGVVLNFLDVTELNRAEESRAFLAAIVDSSDDSIISIDFAGRITSWNASAEGLYGYSAAEALGQPLSILTLPEGVAQVLANIERIKQSQAVAIFDMVRVQKGGREICLSVSLSPVKNRRGEVIGISTIARDITARRRAEAGLALSEEQFRRAIEDAPIPVIMHAEDGQVLQVSKAWTALTGYTPDKIPTLDAWLSHTRGASGTALRNRIQQLFRGESRQLFTEFDLATKTGEHRSWVFSASMPGTLRDGRRFIVGMALDITERKHAEEALRESQERLRLIVENAREYAIFAMDPDRRITSWNSGATRILGYTQEEAIGQTADMIFTGEDRAAGAPEHEAEAALREGRAPDERWHLRKDGSRFWSSGVTTSMHDADGAAVGLVKIFRDHTEQLQAKETLQKSLQETERARAEAEAAGAAKDHFLAVLSHELRTPLTPVLMSVDTLLLRRDLPAQVVEGLDMIQRNVSLEAQFIDELLDLTRISRGKFDLSLEPMNLHDAIRLALEVASPDVKEKSQRLDCELKAATDHLTGDFKRLQQVFWNLLKNASKFTPERGGITVRSRNEPATSDEPPRIVVEVSDTGIGFEAGAAERIFDAFTQASAAITQEFGGLGLGLAISKATVDAHQGTIRAHSGGANQGATFTVGLPISERP